MDAYPGRKAASSQYAFAKFFDFTVGQAGSFLLSVITDTTKYDPGPREPKQIKILQTTGGSASCTKAGIPQNYSADIHVFKIENAAAGDVYEVLVCNETAINFDDNRVQRSCWGANRLPTTRMPTGRFFLTSTRMTGRMRCLPGVACRAKNWGRWCPAER